MIQAHVCLKRIVIIREIKARIAWSVADVKYTSKAGGDFSRKNVGI